MKALLLSSIYPSLRRPTLGTFNHNVFRSISAHCETRVISPRPFWTCRQEPATIFRAPRETQTGLETLLPAYWSLPKVTSLHARGMYASLRPHVANLYREFPFEIIMAAWAYPDAVAAAGLASEYKCPLVVKILGSDINNLAQLPALRPQIQKGLQRAQCVITVSEALRERVIELGIAPERVLTQHNGVDGKKFKIRSKEAIRQELKLSTTRPFICYVGRLGQEKGLDVLLDAMHALATSGRGDIDLHLIGGGEQEENLRAQVARLKLESQVHFHGMRPHDEIPLWVSAGDLLCLPSRREGCPNVVLEALASGRPVVASHVGGLPELIQSDNGILVPSENPAALAQALHEALQRSWSPEALRNTVEYLSWEDVGQKYYQTLSRVMDDWKRDRHAALSASARHAS
jgi:glycosyltransferase involved in cell wall biosynthesis